MAYKMKSQLCFALMVLHVTAYAEVTLDGSAGAPGPVNINNNTYLIDSAQGNLAGSNLFHSFGHFNLETGTTALFTDSSNSAISNVISRVTGGASSIDGTIRSLIPNADFYLINPAGIVFGPNAQLDVPGAFYASTASLVKMADGTEFSAITNNDPTLLTAAPSAFGFLENSADLQIQGSSLITFANQSMHFSGANLHLANAFIGSVGGAIELSAVGAGSGLLTPGDTEVEHSMTASGNLFVDNSSWIRTLSNGNGHVGDELLKAGKIEITGSTVSTETNIPSRAGNIHTISDQMLLNGSLIGSSTYSSGDSGNVEITATRFLSMEAGAEVFITPKENSSGNGGQLVINAPSIGLTDGSVISAESKGSGQGGDIQIHTDDFLISNHGSIWTSAYGIGDGGDLSIIASRRINMTDSSGIYAGSYQNATGNAGNVSLITPEFSINNRSSIDLSSRHVGDAGNLAIVAGEVDINNASLTSASLGQGDGGLINVSADNIFIRGNGFIATFTNDSGAAGNIELSANNQISITGESSAVLATTTQHSSGDAGKISIASRLLTLDQGGYIDASNQGNGTTQGIDIASDQIRVLNGSSIGSITEGASPAGDIIIKTNALLVSGPSPLTQIVSYTTDTGDAGNIYIGGLNKVLADNIKLDYNANINAASSGLAAGSGTGGNINLFAKNITLDHGAYISALSVSDAPAGHIGINSFNNPDALAKLGINASSAVRGDKLDVLNNSKINVVSAYGDAGNIEIYLTKWLNMLDSRISTTAARGNGSGGNIFIDPQFVILNNSQIVANAQLGSGGLINIITDFFLPSIDSIISASSASGLPELQGTVSIQSQNSNIAGSIGVLPGSLRDVSNLLNEDCAAAAAKQSSFTVGGRGSLPLSPDNVTSSGFQSVQCGVGL